LTISCFCHHLIATMADKIVSLRDTRERTIAILSDLFAKDEIELDDFENRVSLVHRAGSVDEVQKVVADLTVKPEVVALVPQPKTSVVPASELRPTQTLAAILGGVTRRGGWNAAQHLRVIAFMGGAELDFREARLGAGVTELTLFVFMGGVQLIVPPELSVELNGTGIMGGFDHMDRQPPVADPERPILRVHGVAFMGGVSVETRLPGESHGQARRRERRERKDRERRER
jgi:hypothetical protein